MCPLLLTLTSMHGAPAEIIHSPFLPNPGLESRSISFENPTGARGAGGTASSKLGPGRKGSPSRSIKPGETVTLCDITGMGTIRHMWMTTTRTPEMMRSFVIRAYWEGQEHPSIEAPLGDFMGFAHGKVMSYQSAVHSVGSEAGLNFWLPMPFLKQARFTLTNESEKAATFFYQIDYTLGDRHPPETGRLHVLFRRENLTTLTKDFEILPRREGSGRYIGAVIGVRSLNDEWWGEGELKVYLDGDKELPTINGTGSEDYVGLSWGIQESAFQYLGCSLNQKNFISMYRWHLPDPIYWEKDCRITMQQIGLKPYVGLYERADDWSCATFWYERVPSARLPALPDLKARTADLWVEATESKN